MDKQKSLAWPTYLVAFALSVIPPFDALMQVLPAHAHDPHWRFGFFGLMSNALLIPLVGLLIAFIAAAYFEHLALQKMLGAIASLVSVILLGMLCMFALDALQVRSEVKPIAVLAFNVASFTAAIKSLVGIASLGAFGIAAFNAPKIKRPHKQRSADVVVGGHVILSKPPRQSSIPTPGVPTPVATES